MPFPVDRKYIEATEQKLGGTFPDSFVAKMMAENGGEVAAPFGPWQLHPFLDTSEKKRLSRTCNDIVRETQCVRSMCGSYFPPDAVNIGMNLGGDHLVFLLVDGRIGPEVYWWDHETGDLDLVADDFSELLG